MHEHIWLHGHCDRADTLELFGEEWRLREEVRLFADAGGGAIVEAPVYGAGRDGLVLKRVSEETGVAIVMSAGRSLEELFAGPEALSGAASADLSSALVGELEEGVSGVRAGMLTQMGTRTGAVSPNDARVLRAIAAAHRRTGAPMSTHAYASGIGWAQVRFLLDDEGVDPARLIIAHVDTFPSLAYYRALLNRGVHLAFDVLPIADSVGSDGHRVANIARLVAEGYADQIVLSCDVCGRTAMDRHPAHGYEYLQRDFATQLRDAGVPEDALHLMTVANPARLLDV